MTSRSGGATYSTTISNSNSIDNFKLYIGNQQNNDGRRNIYFNNFSITNSGNYSSGTSQTESRALTGSGALIVGNSTTLILTNDGNTFTGGTTVNAGSTLQIGNGGGTGVLPGSVVNNGAVTFNRTGDVTYGGGMSGSGTLTKQGAGALFLSANNTYTGATTISAGTLEAQAANALGTSAAGTTVSSGAVLKLYNSSQMTIAGESLSLAGTGVGGGGALLNTGGNNTWTGGVTLASNARIAADTSGGAGSLTISGTIGGGANALFVGTQSSANIEFSNTVSGAGANLSDHGNVTTSIFKDGVAALTLSGANSFTGATLLSNGTILVGNNAAFGAGLVQVHFAEAGAKTIASTDGTARNMSNSLNIYNNLNLGAEDRTGSLTFSGGIELGNEAGNRTITTAAGSAHTFSGIVAGQRQIIKEGAGSLALSNSNTFSGGVQLNNGTLLVGNNNGLGTGTLQVQFATPGSKTIASADATARTLNNNINVFNDFTLGQASGGTGSLTLNGTFYLGDEPDQTRIVTVLGNHAISGAVTGLRGLVKQGSGTLTFSGANTSNGSLYIDNGVANLNGGSIAFAAIDIGSGVDGGQSANNATLRVSSASSYSRPIIVNAEGATSGARTIDFANTSGTATLSGGVTLEKAAAIVVASGGTGNISGAVTGSHLITKSGAGTLLFNNTVAGPVTVTAGTLGGNTTISGLVTLNSGATVAPGNSVGTMNFSAGLTLNATSTVRMEITTTNGNADRINVTGGMLTYAGSLVFEAPSMVGVTNNNYTLFDTSGATVSGTWGSVALASGGPDFVNNSGIWTRNAGDGNVWTYNQAAGTLNVIPEPSTYALMGVGAAFILWRIRRRRKD